MENGRSMSICVKLQESKKSKTAPAGKIPKDQVSRGFPSPARSSDGTARKSGRRLRLRRCERAGVAGRATSVLPLPGPASARDGESAGPGTLPCPPASPLSSPLPLWVLGGIRLRGGEARAKGCWRFGGTTRLGGGGRGRSRMRKGPAGDALEGSGPVAPWSGPAGRWTILLMLGGAGSGAS